MPDSSEAIPLLDRRQASLHIVDGNGYEPEAAEVQRCLRVGLLESPDMPLDESVAIMRALSDARRAWREA